MPRRVVLAGALAILLLLLLAIRGDTPPITAEELRGRVESSRPTWTNYPEDIKAQIGARPSAEWNGEPHSVERNADTIRVRFTVRGPWATRSPGLPILMREPFGGVHHPTGSSPARDFVEYEFRVPDLEGHASLPWIEIQYPHATRRIALDPDGRWNAEV